MKYIFLSLLTLMLFNFSPDAVGKDKFDREVERVAFKSKIAGSTWSYTWREREYIFSFSKDGGISKLHSWSSVVWVAKEKDLVVLESGSQKMHLHFNKQGNAFKTVDWDGQLATGKLLFVDDF
ncbi:hypothetical protein [Aestuariibacter sp. A3R04]|uniref:hypothetical protein n=1 Tax=Aestuariibacter sp. A3R04 TaxID=2841571 RepID=UPI001C09541B|nr:hypothetical protein [Aestuariibacter sp. A3R04]MBU3020622.1 hypothetical protein [Aestuariibacter sp. A3R04]